MGLFKQMKDMKAMADAAPGMVAAAQQMGAQAQALAAAQAQQAAAVTAAAASAPSAAELAPIAGVTLERYAEVSRGLAAYGYDAARAPEVAAAHGIDAADWQAAVDGWNARIQANPAVARAFNQAYTGR